MDWRRPAGKDLHPVGFSGHKNGYRRGVCEGNYAEEILAADNRGTAGFLLDRGGAFNAKTTSGAAYALSAGKAGAQLAAEARRHDIFLKHCKYGRSQVLADDRTPFYASTSQLAYGFQAVAGVDQAAHSQPKVQDCLWGHTKFENRRVPVNVRANAATTQRRLQLETAAAASPYLTVEKEMIEAAARDPQARAAARPRQAKPRDVDGEDTSVGRKPAGEFCQLFDKDWVRIGLRARQ